MSTLQSPRILVVNDDEVGRYAMSRMLRQAGFQVQEASTGTDGLELAARGPDLILLDVNLPDMSGLEVSSRLKADPETVQIPILHVSATFIDADSQVRGLESGADGYLTYPLEPTVLVATVRAHLRLREIEAQRQELALLLEDVNDAIIVTSPDLLIQRWNRGAERIYGWTEKEVLGLDLWELLCARSSEEERDVVLHDLREAGRWEGESQHLNRQNEPVYVQSSLTLGSSARRGSGKIVIVNRDVSEQRRAELERERLVEELRRLNTELESRVEERTEELTAANRVLISRGDELEALAYSISHDVRAPLRGIDGFSNVLLQDYGERLGEDGRAYLQRITGAARLMGELIDHLLELSRLSRRATTSRRVELSSLARELMTEIENELPERTIEFSTAEDLVVEGDENLLRALLSHLLSNAIKFTEPCDVARIAFGMDRFDGQEVFFVRDNGVGFDPRYSSKLFTAFQHLHPPTRFPGAGVGLATVRRVVHRHGGHVWAESSPGSGATFFFTLPHAPDKLESGEREEVAT